MSDHSPPQSIQHDQVQYEHHEDVIRQGYKVQDLGGQIFIVPNALDGVEASLAKMVKPDFARAVKMAAGVSFVPVGILLSFF